MKHMTLFVCMCGDLHGCRKGETSTPPHDGVRFVWIIIPFFFLVPCFTLLTRVCYYTTHAHDNNVGIIDCFSLLHGRRIISG